MPPRKATEQPPQSLEDVVKILNGLSTQFTSFTGTMATVDNISKQLANMETKLNHLVSENTQLKASIKAKDNIIEELKAGYTRLEERLNTQEQYNRSWSMRVLNIPLSADEEKNPSAVLNKVYTLAFKPALQGAVEAGELLHLPSADELLEVAHVLPGKEGSNKPIIARFYNRYLRSVCLRYKREFATRTTRREGTAGSGGGTESGRAGRGGEDRGWVAFPFFEDLTRANFAKMRSLAKDERVQSSWSVNGIIRYKLVDSTTIKKVTSIFMSNDEIIGK